MLKITLLGQFSLRIEDKPVELTSRPAQTLLAYLLLNRSANHRRERLAGLMWPDSSESSARQSLRNALYQLRQAIGDDYLLADKSSLAFNEAAPHSLDVTLLKSEPVSDDPDELMPVLSVYEGDLLPGFYEDWILLERERLRALFEQRLRTLLDGLGAAARWQEMQAWAERWIALGHVPEPAYRALMMSHAAMGDQAGMATSYRRCIQALDEELGVAPSSETQALYERLSAVAEPQARQRPPATPQSAAQANVVAPETTRQRFLPSYATPLVGRQEELEEIGRLLQQEPGCRLLTLVGPGGIGKTRLAIEVAKSVSFAQGAWFVPLAMSEASTSLATAIADVLELQLDGTEDSSEQLVAYLRQRELLLILDNFEHMLLPSSARDGESGQDVTSQLTEVLERAPLVKVLVTSRRRLNLSAEWVFNVEGLPTPADLDELSDGELRSFSAVQLFLQRARQFERGFGEKAGELTCVARICQLAGGMPLAIELAAAWVNVLECREIRQEIERNLKFLRTSMRDYPERHRDIRAVFDSSWNMLAEPERKLFRKLSVFRGGFTRAAAEAIGGDAALAEDGLSLSPEGTLQLTERRSSLLAALAQLVDKSFVRHAGEGRYEIHELMRQYGAAKLLERPSEERSVKDNHALYYLTFLVNQEASLKGPRQRQGVARVASEMENINSAWKRAVVQGKLTVINKALSSYFNFCMAHSRLREGEEAFARLLAHLQQAEHLQGQPQNEVIRARAFIRRAALNYLLGQYDEARNYAEEGLSLELGADYRSDMAFGQIVLGVVAGWQGDKELAERWLHSSLDISQEIDDKENMADALHELAQLKSSFGNYREAKHLAQQSLDISRAYGRPDWIAHALVTLGWAVVCLGEYAEAEARYREALSIFESLDNRHGAAEALDGLGWIAWCQEDFDEASRHYERSLAAMRELGLRRILANTLCDMAILANEQQEFSRAEAISKEGLDLANQLGSDVYRVPYLCCLGWAIRGSGDYADGRRLLNEAIRLAHETELWPPVAMILYEYAQLLVAESEATATQERPGLQRKTLALELLTFVRTLPSTWQAICDRAARLQTKLEAALPEDLVASAVARGNEYTLDRVVNKLLQSA